MEEIYTQVSITLTTINVVAVVTLLLMFISEKISDYLKKRKEKKNNN